MCRVAGEADFRLRFHGGIAVEADPAVLSPDLGGKIMEVEKKYQNA
jgi:hypothetical protein